MNHKALASIAGAGSNSELIWWIGAGTKKAFRRKGLASALVNKTAIEAIEKGKIPVYVTTWYSNIPSRKTALRAGFLPGFVELGCE